MLRGSMLSRLRLLPDLGSHATLGGDALQQSKHGKVTCQRFAPVRSVCCRRRRNCRVSAHFRMTNEMDLMRFSLAEVALLSSSVKCKLRRGCCGSGFC